MFDVKPNIIGVGYVTIDEVTLNHVGLCSCSYKRFRSIDTAAFRGFAEITQRNLICVLFTHLMQNVITCLWQLTLFF